MFRAENAQGGRLDNAKVEVIRELIHRHPEAHRRRLSRLLCEAWDWRNEQGRYKDMAARRLMLKLHQRGEITLPPRRRPPTNGQRGRRPGEAPVPGPPLEGPLSLVQPLEVELISPASPHRTLFQALLAHYHYLSYRGPVGENLQYLAWSASGQPVACLVFEAAAWKVAARDRWLGWKPAQREARLARITNNSRLLILPWVRVPQLASHLLSLVTRRLRADWQFKYRHPVELVETFVERERFRGCSYRAANWLHLGATQGRSRNDRRRELSVPFKDVYVYPLHRRFRQALSDA